jgi:hypothetical protein
MVEYFLGFNLSWHAIWKGRVEILLSENYCIVEFNTTVYLREDNSIRRNNNNMGTSLEFYYYCYLQLGRIYQGRKLSGLLLKYSYLMGGLPALDFFWYLCYVCSYTPNGGSIILSHLWLGHISRKWIKWLINSGILNFSERIMVLHQQIFNSIVAYSH